MSIVYAYLATNKYKVADGSPVMVIDVAIPIEKLGFSGYATSKESMRLWALSGEVLAELVRVYPQALITVVLSEKVTDLEVSVIDKRTGFSSGIPDMIISAILRYTRIVIRNNIKKW